VTGPPPALSSLTMVPTAVPSLMVAFTGLDNVTAKASVASTAVSPATATVNVRIVAPGEKLSVPVVAA
jgi:hypothetical protein